MSTADYDVLIDWEDDGDFTDTGNDVTARVLAAGDLKFSYGRDQARSLAAIRAGETAFRVNNESKDYSPDNASSPLAGNLEPGKSVLIRATFNSTTYNLFRGYLDEYEMQPASKSGVSKVAFTALDTLHKLKQVTLSTPVHESIQTGKAIEALLDAAGWPCHERDIDQGASTLRWWWEEGTDGLEALKKIVDSEGPPAFAFVDAEGKFVFRDRHHRTKESQSKIVQATFQGSSVSETAVTGGTIMDDFNRANDATAIGTSTTGQVWADWSGAIYGISSNQAYKVSGTGPAGFNLASDGTARVTIATMEGSSGIHFRGTGSSTTGWYWRSNSLVTDYTLESYDGVSLTVLGTAGVTPVTGDVLQVKFAGSSIKGYINGVLKVSGTSSTYLTQTWHGLSAGGSAVRFEDFSWAPVVHFSEPFTYDIGWRDLINQVVMEVEERVAQPESVVWSTDAPFVLNSGENKTLEIKTNDPFINAATPNNTSAIQDIEFNTGSISNVTVALTRTSGQSAVLVLTATSSVIVTKLNLRAQSVPVARKIKVVAENPVSILKHGVRTAQDLTPKWVNQNDAFAIARIVVAQRGERRPIVNITVNNANDVRLTQILARDLSDRIHIIESDETGLDDDFFIEQIEHTISKAGKKHTVRFGCERVISDVTVAPNFFTFDKSGSGFNQGVFGEEGHVTEAEKVLTLDDTGDSGKLDVAKLGF